MAEINPKRATGRQAFRATKIPEIESEDTEPAADEPKVCYSTLLSKL
jgi:hypothetical protein